MSVLSDIWEAADRVCDKYGIGGGKMPKNNSVVPAWSYVSGDVRIIENDFAGFELRWNGKTIASSTHPANLLRFAYAKRLLTTSQVADICLVMGINQCHVFDNDR